MQPTTPLEPEPDEATEPEGAGQGGEPQVETEPRTPRSRRKRAAVRADGKVEGRRLYLSEGVHFRLRMLAYQRGENISKVAEDVLDKALPKWDVNRVG